MKSPFLDINGYQLFQINIFIFVNFVNIVSLRKLRQTRTFVHTGPPTFYVTATKSDQISYFDINPSNAQRNLLHEYFSLLPIYKPLLAINL